MSKKKMTLIASALVVVLLLTVGGTLAFFTDTTQTATNTFTIGKVDVELVETSEVPEGSNYTAGTANQANGFDYSNVVPGTTYAKKPVITLKSDSQPAYVFAELTITNYSQLIAMLQEAYTLKELDGTTYPANALNEAFLTNETLSTASLCGGWYDAANDTQHVVYDLGKWEANGTRTLFDGVAIPGGLDKALAKITKGVDLTVKAYAAQAENNTAAAAYSAFFNGYTYGDLDAMK